MGLFAKSDKNKDKNKQSLEIVDNVKKDVDKHWEQFKRIKREEEEAYFGAIWKNNHGYRPYENEIFEIIETEVPILSDNFPAPSVDVTKAEMRPQAMNLEKAIQWVNEDQDFILKLPEVVRAALIAGPGWIHVYHDINAANGNGRDIYEVIDYKRVRLGGSGRWIEDAGKCRLELDRSKEWLKLTYPKFADKIDKLKAKESERDDSYRGYEQTDSGAGYARRTVPNRYHDEDELVLVKTFKRDYSIEPIPADVTQEELEKESEFLQNGEAPDVSKWQDHKAHMEQHANERAQLCAMLQLPPNAPAEEIVSVVEQLVQQNPEAADQFQPIPLKIQVLDSHSEEHEEYLKENPKSGRLKYKNGLRCIETVQRIVLYDGPSKDDHCEIPLVPFYCYRDGTFYGSSEVRNLLDSARMKATLNYKTYRGLALVADPQKEVNIQSGLTKNDITNEPAAVYEVKEGTGWSVRNVPPGEVSNQSIQWQNERAEKMREISGMNDPIRGELPDHQVSEVTVSKSQGQALARIRLKDRQIQHYSIKRLGKLVASNIIQYWTSERVLYLEGEDSDLQEIVFNPMDMQDLEYDIKISSESMAGIDKDQANLFATSLLNTGKITFAQYAELVNMPNSDKLRKFAAENNEVEAQMQEMQGQMEQQAQEMQAIIDQLQKENLKLKAINAPATLKDVERKDVENIIKDEQYANITGVNEDQPGNIGA